MTTPTFLFDPVCKVGFLSVVVVLEQVLKDKATIRLRRWRSIYLVRGGNTPRDHDFVITGGGGAHLTD